MMSAILFDSHKYAKRLVAAGVPEKAADVQVEMMLEFMTLVEGQVAYVNKQDGGVARPDCESERLLGRVDVLEARIQAHLAEFKADMVGWIGVVGLVQTALIALLVLKLVP
ncbi:MAG: hypothetical protein V4462_01345 [Pseudomonadota bacterium]